VIVILSELLESVLFPLPKSLINWHASDELVDAIPLFEAWEAQSGVFFMPFFLIPHWIYMYSSGVGNG